MAMGRIRRFASSSFQLAMLYAFVVTATMIGMYFFSTGIVADLNAWRTGPDAATLPESYIFAQLAPLILLVMIVIAGLSFFISEFVVRRINTINTIAEDIMRTGDLSRRIPIENEWDDLSKLAIMLNRMLEQIERLLLDMRTVSDNIAHDMRTPLTRLHQRIERLLAHPELAHKSALREEASAMLAETAHLLATFNALLRISNIEKGKRRAEYSDVRLAALVADAVELYEPLAEEKRMILSQDVPPDLPPLRADKHLLFQALANLLDNAVKYTPEGGTISLHVVREETGVAICLRDGGPGIAEAEQERVFLRFYRADASRTLAPGNGLGLSLVRAVMELHGGTVALRNAQPGLEVRLFLPV